MNHLIKKRGLSPVIATTLLILIAVILAILILLWIRSFIGEKAEKDLGGGAEAVENFCNDVRFDGNARIESAGNIKIEIVNEGNVPIRGIQVKKKGLGFVSKVGTYEYTQAPEALVTGESYGFDIGSAAKSGDKLVISPILLGKVSGSEETKKYVCDEEFGIVVEVK